jgi:hypothetical protein
VGSVSPSPAAGCSTTRRGRRRSPAEVARLRTSGAKGAVYVHATRGSESINAFVSAWHVYPVRTAVTIVPTSCGHRLTWAALEGRRTTWVISRTPRGLELRTETEVHQFFGQSDRTTYEC